MRSAFGTIFGVPEPETFMGDRGCVRPRWQTDPASAFAAEIDGEVVGSNFATCWGSVGFFGPLTVRPDLWDRGIGKALMEPIIESFKTWGTRHAGLFTFADSEKHIGLYQRFGFWPRFLTALMAKPVSATSRGAPLSRYSQLPASERNACLDACREITSALYDGLNLQAEIEAVANHKLGDTVLLWDGSALCGFAVCHSGPGTEGGSDSCYVKFAGVRPGIGADAGFERLLEACEAYAAFRGVQTLVAGVNMGRHEAYRSMLAQGFRTQMQGVAMHKPNEPGYSRLGVYAIDDWR